MESVTIFSNPQFGEVRTAGTPENPLFCLADVCKALDLVTTKVAQRLSEDVLSKHPLETAGGIQQANFITEDGLYDVILDSRKPEAKAFRKWVTSEVIPSIRKHGAYMTDDTLKKAILTPDFLIRLATELKTEKEANRQLTADNVILTQQKRTLEEENRQMTQKAEYADKVLNSVTGLTFTQVAKDLGIRSVKKFQEELESRKIIYRQSGMWMPASDYADKGYFATRTISYVDLKTREAKTRSYTIMTELGRAWLHMLFDKERKASATAANK